MTDLQKASFGKRIIAAICDLILISILAVGFMAIQSSLFGYDRHINDLNSAYDRYEAQYGIEFQITQSEYEALSEDKKAAYDEAYNALIADEGVKYSYNMVINLTMLILSLSVLISVILVEFVVPLIIGNGQTVGKKIFGIALMHTDGIKVSSVQLFARAVLGKFAIEMMIPLSVIIMIFFNTIGVVGLMILLILLVAQIVCLSITKTNALLHDVLASTIAVDSMSQKIFGSREELLEYKKKVQKSEAERAAY